MKYSKEEYDELVAAVGAIVNDMACDIGVALRRLSNLKDAYEPFVKPKPARVGIMGVDVHDRGDLCQEVKAIELTDAVKLRNGPTAGVDIYMMTATIKLMMSNYRTAEDIGEAIAMRLADTAPSIESEL